MYRNDATNTNDRLKNDTCWQCLHLHFFKPVFLSATLLHAYLWTKKKKEKKKGYENDFRHLRLSTPFNTCQTNLSVCRQIPTLVSHKTLPNGRRDDTPLCVLACLALESFILRVCGAEIEACTATEPCLSGRRAGVKVVFFKHSDTMGIAAQSRSVKRHK